jgi:alcohol dehydrogenase (cytochrome c)
VFTGDIAGNFYAFDKATGNLLHQVKVDGSIAGGIVTYSVDGTQYVALTSGNVSRSTSDTKGSPKNHRDGGRCPRFRVQRRRTP